MMKTVLSYLFIFLALFGPILCSNISLLEDKGRYQYGPVSNAYGPGTNQYGPGSNQYSPSLPNCENKLLPPATVITTNYFTYYKCNGPQLIASYTNGFITGPVPCNGVFSDYVSANITAVLKNLTPILLQLENCPTLIKYENGSQITKFVCKITNTICKDAYIIAESEALNRNPNACYTTGLTCIVGPGNVTIVGGLCDGVCIGKSGRKFDPPVYAMQ